jgi:hypothetical protein
MNKDNVKFSDFLIFEIDSKDRNHNWFYKMSRFDLFGKTVNFSINGHE